MKKQTKKWTKKDGTKIRICDMEDLHLLNTIKMIERKAKSVHESELRACASISFMGEMAQHEQESFLMNSRWQDFLPEIYHNMIEEAANREII